MTPRPFYRFRLFWLGLPGLLFLLWAWFAHARSELILRYAAVTGPTEAKGWGIASDAGVVGFFSREWAHRPYGPEELGWSAVNRGWVDPEEPGIYFPHRPFGMVREEEGKYRHLWLAWWVIALGYATIWLGAMGWWQRRKSRLLKLHTAP